MNLYIQLNYPNIGPSKAFILWWSVFVLQSLGKVKKLRFYGQPTVHILGSPLDLNNIHISTINIHISLWGSRLLFNVAIICKAKKNPEFLGYIGKPFPRQLPPRPLKLEPRRSKLPLECYNDWKKIGSKRTKFDTLGLPLQKRHQASMVPVEIE